MRWQRAGHNLATEQQTHTIASVSDKSDIILETSGFSCLTCKIILSIADDKQSGMTRFSPNKTLLFHEALQTVFQLGLDFWTSVSIFALSTFRKKSAKSVYSQNPHLLSIFPPLISFRFPHLLPPLGRCPIIACLHQESH